MTELKICPKCGHNATSFVEAWDYKTGQVYLKNECLLCHHVWYWEYPILDEHGNETGQSVVIKTREEWVKFCNNPNYTLDKVDKLIEQAKQENHDYRSLGMFLDENKARKEKESKAC